MLLSLTEISEDEEEIFIPACYADEKSCDKMFKTIEFVLDTKDIELLNKIGYENPLNYPIKYFKLYEREKAYIKLNGCDNLIQIGF